jgi:hypothetical protein
MTRQNVRAESRGGDSDADASALIDAGPHADADASATAGLATAGTREPLAVLRRIRATAPVSDTAAGPAPERCELCAVEVAPDHRHVVNLDSRALLCACRPCALLFDGDAAHTYRTVPDRYLALPDALTQAEWEALEVPVGLAFVFRNSRQGRTVVCYPGPAGATEAELPLGLWDALVAREPVLGGVTADVEAVLVRAERDGFACFVVPIDACYELVGLLRVAWRGFDGGPEARARIAEFFERVGARCPARSGRVKAAVTAEAVART